MLISLFSGRWGIPDKTGFRYPQLAPPYAAARFLINMNELIYFTFVKKYLTFVT